MIQTRRALIALTLAAASVIGCSKKPATGGAEGTGSAAPAAAPAPTAAAAPAPTATSAPPPAEGAASAPAMASHATPPPAAARSVTGTVVETMDAAGYTYVRVKNDTDDIWAAANTFRVKVGQRLTVPLEMPMENFHSNALNRDFPLIYFTPRITREGQLVTPMAAPAAQASAGAPPARGKAAASPAQNAPAQMPPGHPPAGMQMPPHPPVQQSDAINEVIAQPAGATSIGKIWDTRKALSGKTVTVRGKVVKVNTGIMGRNWIHLQDGTGTAADRTNDLTVTTDEDARVGDVVTVTGTVAVDRDFGAGYAYPVILEKAKLTAK